MSKTLSKIIVSAAALTPLFAYADHCVPNIGLCGIMNQVEGILNFIIPILFVLATVIFLWGVITYLTAAGDEIKMATGKTYMMWGIVGLFVMLVVWGLVKILVTTFGVGGTGVPDITDVPQLP